MLQPACSTSWHKPLCLFTINKHTRLAPELPPMDSVKEMSETFDNSSNEESMTCTFACQLKRSKIRIKNLNQSNVTTQNFLPQQCIASQILCLGCSSCGKVVLSRAIDTEFLDLYNLWSLLLSCSRW